MFGSVLKIDSDFDVALIGQRVFGSRLAVRQYSKSSTIHDAGWLRRIGMSSVNIKVKTLVAAKEAFSPGYRATRQRLAVYAVAVGDRLGFEEEALLGIRLLAELGGIPDIDGELRSAMAHDDRSLAVVALCLEFDQARIDGIAATDWFEADSTNQRDPELVFALRAVHDLIQPVGEP
jgi:hypothetical protein